MKVKWCVGLEGTLTVFSAGDMGKEAEGLGLHVGSSPCPLSRLQHFSAGIHSLIHWGSTVYNTLFNRQTTVTTERAATVKHTLLRWPEVYVSVLSDWVNCKKVLL